MSNPEPQRGGFPVTRDSLMAALGGNDEATRERALAKILEIYWRPVYKYLRLRWRLVREDAEDLTQAFFVSAIERRLLERYDPVRARFRTYLRLCVDGHATNERKSASRLKRGGDAAHVSLDFEAAESEIPRSGPRADDPEELFRREWVRSLFGLALEDFRVQCERDGRTLAWTVFERYDVDGPTPGGRLTYADLAQELGVPVTKVTNDLHLARRLFRDAVIARLRDLCANESELRAEARDLLGIDLA